MKHEPHHARMRNKFRAAVVAGAVALVIWTVGTALVYLITRLVLYWTGRV